MTQKTAIQEAIEKVQNQIKTIKGFKQSALERKEDDTKYQLTIQELQLVVNSILTPLLPKERQDLIDAHAEGQIFIVNIIKESLPKVDLSETFQEIEKHKSGNDNDETAEQYVHEKFGI